MEYRGFTAERLASYLDHSVLAPTSTLQDVLTGAEVALRFGARAYCVRPIDVALAAKLFQGSAVTVATVIGFPHGTSTTASKVFEARDAIVAGARELDMVINQSAMLSADFETVRLDIAAVVEAVRDIDSVLVKVILETANLTEEQIVTACHISLLAGADFVKTSTGFAASGATVENVALMRATVGDAMGVKASGGIKTLDQVIDLIEAGASRVGLSGTVKIFDEFATRGTKS
jgi:deoxyribose-phosphate aldolase